MTYVAGAAALLVLLQQVQRTTMFFSGCSFLFVILAGLATNAGGGLTRPSGSYAFFYSVLGVIVGLFYKTFLGEPGESNLLQPRLTILVYVVGMFAMYVTVVLSRRFSRKTAFLENLLNDRTLPKAMIGSLVVGTVLTLLTNLVTRVPGSFLSALFQINRFPELTMILGVTYAIRRSGGRSSVNLPVALAAAVMFVIGGMLSFSKQGMFTPVICWFLAAAAQGYRLNRVQVIGGGLAVLFMALYLVPYSQYGRTQTAGTIGGNVAVSMSLLSNLGTVRQIYKQQEAASVSEGDRGYYNTPQGLADRLQIIFVDDALINATEQGVPLGIYPILTDFENLVPHVFWADKPSILWGNVYAHEAGLPLEEEDESTGVSFSPTAEAFHSMRWVGLLVLAPVIWFMTFVLFDSLCGDVRRSPWALLMTVAFAHVAPEGMLGSLIYLMGFGAFGIVFTALTSAYVLPLIGSIASGPASMPDIPSGRIRSLPKRVSTIPATETPGS